MDLSNFKIKTLKDAILSKKLTHSIKRSISEDNFPRLLLIHGQWGTGKTELASLISKAINCEQFLEIQDVCNTCKACLSSNQITKLNCSLFNKKHVHNLLRCDYNYAPTFRKRVIIFDEAQEISESNQKSLLVPFDNIPDHVLIIFCTSQKSLIIPPLLNRMVKIHTKPLNTKSQLDKFKYILDKKGLQLEIEEYNNIVKSTDGTPRDIIISCINHIYRNESPNSSQDYK